MVTHQDFENAYIAILSGTAKLNQYKEIECKSKYGNIFYISFPYFPDSSKAIVKCYYENGNIQSCAEYLNGQLHGKFLEYNRDKNTIEHEYAYFNGILFGFVK